MTSDRIVLHSIGALGRHGVLAEEQHRAQPFEVDVEIEADLSLAGRNDDLGSTVDYGAVIEAVVGIVEQRSYALIEALADAVAADVLASHRRAAAVTVEVRKLRPPVPAPVGSVGVRVRRVRADG